MIFTPKKHWYAFAFVSGDGRSLTHASTYTGYLTKGITLARINEAKASADVDQSAVLIAVSYLGRMTRESFAGGEA